jgi:protein-tyrosine-phosphatase
LSRRLRILFVCTGNTCRSPLAEVIMKNRIRETGLEGVATTSAGTAADRGIAASPNARAVAKEMGLSLTRHRSKPLTDTRVARADLVLTMTGSQRTLVMEMWPAARERVFVLPEYSGSGRGYIDDPIGQPLETYRKLARVLQDEVKKVLLRVRRETSADPGEVKA